MLDVQPNLLRRAIRNLVDNALKYGGGAEIDVRGEPGEVRISVLDRGPGLPQGEIARITGAFYRAEPREVAKPAVRASVSLLPRRSSRCTAER